MSIKYSLFRNHLTADPNDYMAVVQDQTTRTIDDLIKIMLRRGSTVTEADIRAVLQNYKEAIAEVLENGDSVITDLFRITPSIPGVFTDQTDRFDPSRHYVSLNMNRGSIISEIARNLTVEKVEAVKPRPSLQVFKDVETDTTNEAITPGGPGELIGNRMKVSDSEDEQQGIFLIAGDGSETKAETIIRNKPANLIFIIPEELESGEYELEVRTTQKNGEALRSGRLDTILVVP